MKTFCIQTLGCKVNQYESEQVATLLRSRGLRASSADEADLRIINSCSVTVQAASQSRQSVRQMVRRKHPSFSSLSGPPNQPRVLVIGCWATSDKAEAAAMAGVDKVLTHQDDLAVELDRLLTLWQAEDCHADHACVTTAPTRPTLINGWMLKDGTAPDQRTSPNKPEPGENVNRVPSVEEDAGTRLAVAARPQLSQPSLHSAGANSLPILGDHQTGRQRAFLKIQDGCDAHCTYCIIPKLRPVPWSKPVEDAVEEARRLVDAGHLEIVLTGIFLGAYGQPTALRRRQPEAGTPPLAQLVNALCSNVPGLKRLRLSSLEPGDLSDELLAALLVHPQLVPHFHLPLQSGSDLILRRMNRQYRRDDFVRMIDRVNESFDRPALTTDIIVGFPGETDAEFGQTLEVVEQSRFIHIHAFPYSPRPGTAAARRADQFVRGPVVNRRIEALRGRAQDFSFEYRKQFTGEMVEVITERDRGERAPQSSLHAGRCERYFAVHFEAPGVSPGDLVRVRIARVTPTRTFGEVVR
jgi:MiaB/RimO family radical SAM methylthiotransferase